MREANKKKHKTPLRTESAPLQKASNKNNTMYIMGLIFACIGIIELIAAVFTFIFFKYEDSWIMPMIFMIQGLIFTPLGLGFFLPEHRRRKRRKRLMEYGVQYQAEITDIYYNTSVNINWQSPLIVECMYIDRRGDKILVKSGSIWLRGYAEKEDFYATVYVNPDDLEDYHVEVGVHEMNLENVKDLR